MNDFESTVFNLYVKSQQIQNNATDTIWKAV